MILLFIDDIIMAIGICPDENGEYGYFHGWATEFEDANYTWIASTFIDEAL